MFSVLLKIVRVRFQVFSAFFKFLRAMCVRSCSVLFGLVGKEQWSLGRLHTACLLAADDIRTHGLFANAAVSPETEEEGPAAS